MEWIKAEIEFASTFSYRMPDTSSQFAVPVLLPGPSTIKLALVATSIIQSSKITEGETMFNLLKDAKVKFYLPERVVVFRSLIKRLKAKKGGRGLEQTFGTRGYVLYSDPITLYIGISNISNEDLQKVIRTLYHLRRLGTSDSVLIATSITRESPYNSHFIVEPLADLKGIKKGGLIQKVKDIKSDITFNDVNPFREGKGRKPFVDRYYIIPVKTIKEGGNWVLYQRVNASNW